MGGLIVHEWLESRGGAERVVDAMHIAFPDARLVALWNDAPEKYRNVRESWLARTPLRRHKAAALPLQLPIWRHIVPPTDDLDFVLVSSHLFAHHVAARRTNGDRIPKFVYAHTPARYIWEPALDQRGQPQPVRAASSLLKPLDRARAREAIAIAANSEFVRKRIQRTWRRDAEVIYPPVDVSRIQSVPDWREQLNPGECDTLCAISDGFILGASRFVPYKRLDKVIEMAVLIDAPVVIAGSGPQERMLRELAAERRARATFIINPSTPMLYALYQQARAFVFPPVEDFGIMPVEAMAAGCPVLVNETGGARESVSKIGGGATIGMENRMERTALRELFQSLTTLDSSGVKRNALEFDTQNFVRSMRAWVDGQRHG